MARPHSDAPNASFTMPLVLVLLAIVAAGLYLSWQGGREAPLRTVEIEIPTPEIPAPPGIIPQAQEPAAL